MCIGIPMQVISNGTGYALCEGPGERRRVDTLLVGEHPPGSWLLVFLDTAREVLSEERASQIRQALKALEMAMHGDTAFDHLFADLLEREPQLPEHLKPRVAGPARGE